MVESDGAGRHLLRA